MQGGLIHAVVLDGQGGAESLDWNGIERWTHEHGILWVNLDYAGDDAMAWLGMRSGIDPIVRDALVDRDPRPRALAVGDALLLILRAINLNAGAEPEDMVSLRCWIEPRRIITLRHRTVRAVKDVAQALMTGTGPRSVGAFVTTLVSQSIEPVVTLVDTIDDAVDRIEDAALAAPPRGLRAELAVLRRRAIALRRFIAPQREALTRLPSAAPSFLDDTDRARLREAADRLTRTVEELDAARDRAAVTHEELASRIGELTNRRLYVLSILTAIFLPLGFITSLLGVNVGGIPGRDVEWGFWLLCALFAVAIVVQVAMFRRWRWLGDDDDRRDDPRGAQKN